MNNKIIYIPYHQRLNEVCDFVFQTIKILLQKGNKVNIILSKYAYINGNKIKEDTLLDAFKEMLKNPNFKVIRPLVNITPRKGFRRLHKLHQDIFYKYLSFNISKHQESILWIFWPEDSDLAKCVKRNTSSLVLYDCVDNFTSVDKTLENNIRIQEKSLFKVSDFVFVNSQVLYKIKKRFRKDINIVPQGFDAKSFSNRAKPSIKELKEIKLIKNTFKDIPKPIVGYLGLLSFRLNLPLLIGTIKKLQNISFVVLKAYNNMEDIKKDSTLKRNIDKLLALPNVYTVPLTSSKLTVKEKLEHFDIGIIPYDTKLDFNKYCYPMKVFEYFYVGLPVISTPVEELKKFKNYVKIGNTSEKWKTIIKDILTKKWTNKTKNEQKKLAIENSWENKIEQIWNKLDRNK